MNSAPLSGPVDASTFRNIAKAMSPAVVNIRSTSKQRAQEMTEFFGGGGGGGSDDLLERFFGGGGQRRQRRQQQPREQETQAAGTGFVISKDGYILTNNHVVEGATKVEVQLPRRRKRRLPRGQDRRPRSADRQRADSAGREPKSDLIEVKFGDSSQMQPGDWVMAIGNPVRPRAHRQRRRDQRDGALVPDRGTALRRRAADRRGDQSRQLRRSAAERARRGRRHQHRDLHRLAPGRATSASASRFRSTASAS